VALRVADRNFSPRRLHKYNEGNHGYQSHDETDNAEGFERVAAAKALADSARESRVLEIRGGVMQGRAITAEEVQSLASLPPLEVLRSQVLAAIIAPVTAIAGLVNAPLQNLHGLLDARIEQLGGAEEAPAPAAEAEEQASEEEPEPASEEPTAEGDEPTQADATASAAEESEPEPDKETE